MHISIKTTTAEHGPELAQLRVLAMRDSLEALGRFDAHTAAQRFLQSFVAGDTWRVLLDDQLAGFYVLRDKTDHLWLDHLYINPKFQGGGIGGKIVQNLKSLNRIIRLGALRDSRANTFYQQHGFIVTHEQDWDIYYEYLP